MIGTVQEIIFHPYKIAMGVNAGGKPTASLSKLLTAGPNKGRFKRIEGYYFGNEEHRNRWVEEKKKLYRDRIDEKEARSRTKREARQNMKHGFEVGEIIYDSWGYDQTNIDFYLVSKVNDKSIEITPIGSKMVEGSGGMMSNRVKPDPTNITGEPILKVIQVNIWSNKVVFRISSKHGSFSKYLKGEEGVYSSWYH